MADEVLKIGYDTAVAELSRQDTTLGNIRSRTTGLMAAASVATSFAASVGLLNTDVSKGEVLPPKVAYGLVALVVLLGIINIYVVAPVSVWTYGPNPGLALYASKHEEVEHDVRLELTEAMIESIEENNIALRNRFIALAIGIGLLAAVLGFTAFTLLLP